MTRRERIAALAWTLHDLLPAAKGSSFDPLRRESPSHRVPCPDCGGSDHPGYRAPGVPCLTCGGRLEERDNEGRVVVRRRKGHGRVDVDSYTGRVVSSFELPTVERREQHGCAWCQGSDGGTRRHVRLPRGTGVRGGERCSFCDGTGWRTMTPAPLLDPAPRDGVDDALEHALLRRVEAGSYSELDGTLARLREHNRVAYRAWCRVYVSLECGPDGLDWFERDYLDVAWRFVEGGMPEVVRVPGWALARYRAWKQAGGKAQTRNDLIRRAHADGSSVSELAERFGVSVRTVQRVVYREGAAT